MIKLRALTTILLVVTLTASAGHSNPNTEKFKPCVIGYGVQIGACLSDLTALGVKTDTRSGPMFGGVVVFGYAPYLGLQGEVSYLSKGSAGTKLNYLQFALLSRLGGITTPNDPQTSLLPKMFGGFGISHLLSGEEKHGNESADISLIFGAGADIRFGPRQRLTIDFRYDYGLREQVGTKKNRSTIYTLGVSF